MPCYTVRIQCLELTVKNKDLAIEVLKEMGYDPFELSNDEINCGFGEFNFKTSQAKIPSYNQIKFNNFQQEYSKKILKVAAKKYKFIVKQDTKNPNRFVVNKW